MLSRKFIFSRACLLYSSRDHSHAAQWSNSSLQLTLHHYHDKTITPSPSPPPPRRPGYNPISTTAFQTRIHDGVLEARSSGLIIANLPCASIEAASLDVCEPGRNRECSSVIKKRKKKMNRHKYRKWRKKMKFKRKK